MKEEFDIHNFSRALKRMIEKVQRLGTTKQSPTPITKRNAQLLLDYERTRALEGLKPGSRLAIMIGLLEFARMLDKDFDRLTIEDIKTLIATSDARYAVWTKAKRRVYFKRFYKWVKQGDDYLSTQEYPRAVNWIRRWAVRC